MLTVPGRLFYLRFYLLALNTIEKRKALRYRACICEIKGRFVSPVGEKISRRGRDYESKLTCDNTEILEKRTIAKNKKALQDHN